MWLRRKSNLVIAKEEQKQHGINSLLLQCSWELYNRTQRLGHVIHCNHSFLQYVIQCHSMQPFMSFNTTILTLQCIQHNYSFNINIRLIQCNHSCTVRVIQCNHSTIRSLKPLCYSHSLQQYSPSYHGSEGSVTWQL